MEDPSKEQLPEREIDWTKLMNFNYHEDGLAKAIGKQSWSKYNNLPSYSFAMGTRRAREKQFISKKHSKRDILGRRFQTPGPKYKVYSNLGEGESHVFGTGPQRLLDKYLANSLDSPDTSVGYYPNVDINNRFASTRYINQANVLFGTGQKGMIKNEATYSKTNPEVFYGTQSPGPFLYLPDYKPTKPNDACYTTSKARKFNKDKFIGDTPPSLGPGSYKTRINCIGPQYLSHRKNQAGVVFDKSRRDDGWKNNLELSLESGGDKLPSSFGHCRESKWKTSPSVGFGSGSRARAGRLRICRTELDQKI